MNLKLGCIVRTDLGFSLGLMSAQVSHIAMQPIRVALLNEDDQTSNSFRDIMEWLKKPYTYVYSVGNKESLEYFCKKGKEKGLHAYEWRDTVYVDIGGKKEVFENVLVGITFGVLESDVLKSVVGNLPMLGN